MMNKIPVGMHPDDLMHCDNCGGLVEYETIKHIVRDIFTSTMHICRVCRSEVKSPQSEGK